MRFSPILSLYISRNFLVYFAGGLGIIMGLIFLFDVVELMRRAATHGNAGFLTILELAFLKLPQMLQTILPFAVMAGSMACFWSMTRSRELVVSRSVGVSVWQFLAPVGGVVFLIGILNITAFNPLSAKMYQAYERLQDDMALRGTKSAMSVGEGGLWLREMHGDEQVVVHADEVWQENMSLRLRGVSVFVSDSHEKFEYRLEASVGRLEPSLFHLEKVQMYRAAHPVENFPEYDFDTKLSMEKVQDKFAATETISFWELPDFIRFFEKAGFSANRQKLYYQSMLASPLLLCGMVLISAAFSLRPDMRSGGLVQRIVGGVASGFAVFFFSKVIYALGASATLPVVMAAWIPALITGLAGTGALFHLEDG